MMTSLFQNAETENNKGVISHKQVQNLTGQTLNPKCEE